MKLKVQVVAEMEAVAQTVECRSAFSPKATLSLPWEELNFSGKAYNVMNGPAVIA